MERMNYILLLAAIILIPLILIFYNSTRGRCFTNLECQWKIMNCCTEEKGATWECANIKSFNETKCPKFVICPNISSPKPSSPCGCEEGECIAT